jgi:succinate-semialdehyde dehydrogenase / glutarate-semialdehyde dehydrogenase
LFEINIVPEMEIAQEEVFGPVATIITATDEKEAMYIDNDSKFGLGAKHMDSGFRKGRKIIRNSYDKQRSSFRSQSSIRGYKE